MNSKVHVVLVLVAVLTFFISSEVAARNLAETFKEQIDVQETKEANPPKFISPGRRRSVPCGAGSPYRRCIPSPPRKCEPSVYKRGCPPPNAGEVNEAEPQNQN